MSANDYQKDYSRDQGKYDNGNGSGSSKDFVIGAFIGGIVGAATALILAPKSGKELRSDLNEQAKVLSEKSGQLRQTAMEKTDKLRQTATEKTGQLRQTAAEKTSQLTQVAKEKGAGLAEVAKAKTSSLTEAVSKSNLADSVKNIAGKSGQTGEPSSDSIADGNDKSTNSSAESNLKEQAQMKLEETEKEFEATEKRYNG